MIRPISESFVLGGTAMDAKIIATINFNDAIREVTIWSGNRGYTIIKNDDPNLNTGYLLVNKIDFESSNKSSGFKSLRHGSIERFEIGNGSLKRFVVDPKGFQPFIIKRSGDKFVMISLAAPGEKIKVDVKRFSLDEIALQQHPFYAGQDVTGVLEKWLDELSPHKLANGPSVKYYVKEAIGNELNILVVADENGPNEKESMLTTRVNALDLIKFLDKPFEPAPFAYDAPLI